MFEVIDTVNIIFVFMKVYFLRIKRARSTSMSIKTVTKSFREKYLKKCRKLNRGELNLGGKLNSRKLNSQVKLDKDRIVP